MNPDGKVTVVIVDTEEDEGKIKVVVPEEERGVCVLCNGLLDCKYGHNPVPVAESGRCCDKCNRDKVFPARVKAVIEENEKSLAEKEEVEAKRHEDELLKELREEGPPAVSRTSSRESTGSVDSRGSIPEHIKLILPTIPPRPTKYKNSAGVWVKPHEHALKEWDEKYGQFKKYLKKK